MEYIEYAKAIEIYLIDGFEKNLFQAALLNLSDLKNPLKYNNFTYAIRELIRHVLKRISPDEKIKLCSWYRPNNDPEHLITRRDRLIYAIQGGLDNSFVDEKLGINSKPTIRALLDRITHLSKYTHINPEIFNTPWEQVNISVQETLREFSLFFDEIENCRRSIIEELPDHLDEIAINRIVNEVVPEIDELATHHVIEHVGIDEISVVSLDHQYIKIQIDGNIEVELTYGSATDLRNDQGARIYEHLPFICCIQAYIDDLTEFNDEVDLHVDTSEWYGDDWH